MGCSARVRASRTVSYSLKSSFLTFRLCYCQLITDEACTSNTLHSARSIFGSKLETGQGKATTGMMHFLNRKKEKERGISMI